MMYVFLLYPSHHYHTTSIATTTTIITTIIAPLLSTVWHLTLILAV